MGGQTDEQRALSINVPLSLYDRTGDGKKDLVNENHHGVTQLNC